MSRPETKVFQYRQATGPLLLSFPHDGLSLAPAVAPERLTDTARMLPDTDWWVFQLYDFIASMDISYIRANFSRYVIDLNRPPDSEKLYSGKTESGLCPLDTFEGDPIYRDGEAPGSAEIRARRQDYWQPYHDHLQRELQRIKAIHGFAILWDAHSIAGRLPRLFDGALPELNFGTDRGRSCSPQLASRIMAFAEAQQDYSYVLNGRFTGGYITRHYGTPGAHIHAIQLELNQDTYLSPTPPAEICSRRSEKLIAFLRPLIRDLTNLKRQPA